MVSRQHLPRGRRRRVAALSGVAATIMLGGLSLADPAAAVGPYATCTASPSSSTAPPASDCQGPPAYFYSYEGSVYYPDQGYPYTYQGSSTYRATGYYYTY
jgi:hypothetical protein